MGAPGVLASTIPGVGVSTVGFVLRLRRWLSQDVARSRQWAARRYGGGGVHRVALRPRGDHGGRVRGTHGRAGRYAGGREDSKRHAKTDRSDAQADGVASCCQPASCPSRGSRRRRCWSGSGTGAPVQDVVSTERTMWTQRIHVSSCSSTASRFPRSAEIRSATTAPVGCSGDDVELTPAARHRITVGFTMLDRHRLVAHVLHRDDQLRALRALGCANRPAGRWSTPSFGVRRT